MLDLICQLNLQNYKRMDLTIYTQNTSKVPDAIIGNIEQGTFVERDKKKKKKNKNKNKQTKNRQIDEEKIKDEAKLSELHNIKDLTPEQKIIFSEAENHPLKIICANLPFKITAEQLFSYFNAVISASNPELAVPPPIKQVNFDKARTFAILTLASRRIKDFFRNHPEFTYIEGSTIFKIQKPKTFFEQKYLNKAENFKNAGQDNKIYLGGLPLTLRDHQVRKICQTFGKVKFFNLVKDGAISKGYCFFEYQDPNSSDKAIKALNGLPIVDKRLKCHPATLGNKGLSLTFTPTNQTNVGLREVQVKPANHVSGSYLLSYENIANDDIQQIIRSDPLCKVPSRVLQFLNMFYPEDIYDQEAFEDLQYDLKTQCQKYGPIQKITIPRPDPKCGYSCPTVGKAFVKFMYIIHAKRARYHISGRVYNKRTVVVSFYPEQKFNLKEYLVSI